MAKTSAAAAKARRAEANPETAEPTTFEFGDRTYTVEPDVLDDVELFEAIEERRFITAAKGFVGEEQWQAFKDDHRNEKGRVPLKHVEDFLQALMEAVGAGN